MHRHNVELIALQNNLVDHIDVFLGDRKREGVTLWNCVESQKHESAYEDVPVGSVLWEANDRIVAFQHLFCIFEKCDKGFLGRIRQTSIWNFDVQVILPQDGIPR